MRLRGGKYKSDYQDQLPDGERAQTAGMSPKGSGGSPAAQDTEHRPGESPRTCTAGTAAGDSFPAQLSMTLPCYLLFLNNDLLFLLFPVK